MKNPSLIGLINKAVSQADPGYSRVNDSASKVGRMADEVSQATQRSVKSRAFSTKSIVT